MSVSDYFSGARPKPKRKNIFISYREKDTAGETGRLVDSLKQHFYEDQIFLDIDKIEPGVDFTDVINKSLELCDVLLAVIGPNWAGKNVADNTSRIKDPNDWVKLEIATALQRNIRVVPVLVDGASLPNQEELPEDLHPLLRRQAYEVSNKRWRYDTENLVGFLEKSVGIPTKHTVIAEKVSKPSPVANVFKWGLIGVGALFIIMVIIYAINDSSTSPNKPANIDNTTPNNAVTPGTSSSTPSNSGGGQEQTDPQTTAEKPVTETKNIEGTWYDANGLYYMVFTQNGDQIDLVSYSMLNQKTGEGLGTVQGSNVSFKISILNFGIISAKAKISADENTIRGSTTIENNGAVYNEPLLLNRR